MTTFPADAAPRDWPSLAFRMSKKTYYPTESQSLLPGLVTPAPMVTTRAEPTARLRATFWKALARFTLAAGCLSFRS
jgi:hypothetical protein